MHAEKRRFNFTIINRCTAMKRFILSLSVAVLMAFSIAPAPLHAGGNPVFDFLRVPMNARAAALGNTFLTMRNDATLLFTNPGALATLEAPAASVGFLKHLLDVNAGYAVYGQQVQDIGWLSAGIVYMNYGSMERTDKFGNQLGGTFGAADLAFSVGYGNNSGNLSWGGAVKFIYSYIDDHNSSGLALDAGLSYYIPDEEIVIAAGILHAGTQLSAFNIEKEDLPLDVRLGVGKKLEHLPLTIMLNFHKLNEDSDDFFSRFANYSIGGEFELSESLRARIGYYNEGRREWKIGNTAKLAGFSGGFGINVAGYTVDYAWNSLGEIGAMHRFSLGTTF
jgi:hypothetical protein